jgi:hypothetical protein
MATLIDELSVCGDCIDAIANDDFTALDYHYSGEESAKRMRQIKRGITYLSTLGQLCAGDLESEFSTAPCDCCGSRLAGERHAVTVLG